MKVTQVTTRILRTPADNPLVVGLPPGIDTREFVTVRARHGRGHRRYWPDFFRWTADRRPEGCRGCPGPAGDRREPLARRGHFRETAACGQWFRPRGPFTLALSPIDIALWDIKGKALDQSVCSLLGGCRDRVPTYASGALMRPFPVDYLAKAGPRLVDMGFKQMKTQLGAEPTVAREVERIRVLREGIGEDIDLMCDINQLWNVNQAIEIGRRVSPITSSG